MDRITRARELRAMIETNAQSMEPAQMEEYPELFPEWKDDGREYPAGKIVRRNGELMKVLLSHRSQPDWAPEAAPSLFARVLTDPTGETVQEWVQPDSTNPYMTGDKVLYNGVVYASTADNNVWSPDVYGWVAVL